MKKRNKRIVILLILAGCILVSCRMQPDDKLDRYAQRNGIDIAEYPQELIYMYEKDRDTEKFVFEYPLKKDEQTDMSLDGISIYEVPLLIQWDQRWGYRNYGDGMMGLTGCGPTCLSMVYIYLTGDTSMNPYAMAEFAERNGLYSPGNGSSWALMTEGGRMLGLDVTEIPCDRQRIYDNLDAGNPIIASVTEGSFTSSGHFIVLRERDGDEIYVNDPNSIRNSEKKWNFYDIEDEFAALWVFR